MGMQLWTARVPRTVVITVATIFRIFAILVQFAFIIFVKLIYNCFLFVHFLRNLESLKRGGYDAGCPLLGDTPKPHSSYFLRREERSKEASTPSKASPYMGRMQLKKA